VFINFTIAFLCIILVDCGQARCEEPWMSDITDCTKNSTTFELWTLKGTVVHVEDWGQTHWGTKNIWHYRLYQEQCNAQLIEDKPVVGTMNVWHYRLYQEQHYMYLCFQHVHSLLENQPEHKREPRTDEFLQIVTHWRADRIYTYCTWGLSSSERKISNWCKDWGSNFLEV